MQDFILPDIGEGIVECEIVNWLVSEGDAVKEDQNVVEVMTDKAVVEIPAKYSGVVSKLYYQKGDIAKVHQPLFAMSVEGESQKAITVTSDKELSVVAKTNNTQSVQEDFILPDIGEGIVECEIVEWKVKEGEQIKEDQTVVEVMTDKAVVEIPAKHSGIVSKLFYAKGDIAKVHTPLFSLRREGSDTVNNENGAAEDLEEKASKIDSSSSNQTTPVSNKSNGKALASPAVRRFAREKNIVLSEVLGSGKKGRVLKQDIERFVQIPTPNSDVINETQPSQNRVEPIKGIKAAMAKQMQDAVSTIPHFTVSDEIEMDNLIAVRKQLKSDFEKAGVKLSFMPFIIKALSMALQEFPIINSRVNAECTELTYLSSHNIGMAVDSKIGLLVPNIKNVQDLSVFEVAQEANRLVELAREGKLSSKDLSQGTISISNIGVIGGTVATPVINKPEVAIVALGKMQKLPRFDENGNVTGVNLMQISWSGDHRVIDGATMVRFSNLWKSYIENPILMLKALR